MQPLSGVPTAISITLLDPTGAVVGTLGGDLSTNQFSGIVATSITPVRRSSARSRATNSSKLNGFVT